MLLPLIFRLNANSKCVGYIKHQSASYYFYSKDLYGWSSTEIEYEEKDEHIGISDKNQRLLFEGDMFLLYNNPEPIYFVKWRVEKEDFPVFKIENNTVSKVTLDFKNINPKDIEFYGFLRDNPKLINL